MIVGLPAGRSLYGQSASAKAARTRAEIERKSREIKKTVAEHQRQVREELNLPDPATRAAGASAVKPNGSALPKAESLRKDFKLPDPRSLANSRGPGRKKDGVGYNPRRGQEFAFLVEMTARDGGLYKQWTGKPYFAGVFSDLTSHKQSLGFQGQQAAVASLPQGAVQQQETGLVVEDRGNQVGEASHARSCTRRDD